MNTTPEVGQSVKITGMKPGYLHGMKGTVTTVRSDERGNVVLTPEASKSVRKAIQSRGKPHQIKLFPEVEGCLMVPAVPFTNMVVKP